MASVYLVACVAAKLDRAAPAAALYRSDWFCKARAFVERRGDPWFILSARHGLLDPLRTIMPYEQSLAAMTAAERRQWGQRVSAQLVERFSGHDGPIIFLAGRLYRVPLLGVVGDRAVMPMAGMGIGQQKALLVRQAAALPPMAPAPPAMRRQP